MWSEASRTGPAGPANSAYRVDPAALALLVAAGAALALAGAWGLQLAGYAPCELCLRERLPYYAAIPVALAAAAAARSRRPLPARLGLALLVVLFASGTLLGVDHVGVEQGWWPGPAECSGALSAPAKVADFLHQLETVNVVRCDTPALTVLGLSLAAWNAVVSLVLGALALAAFLRSQAVPDLRPITPARP